MKERISVKTGKVNTGKIKARKEYLESNVESAALAHEKNRNHKPNFQFSATTLSSNNTLPQAPSVIIEKQSKSLKDGRLKSALSHRQQ